MAVNALDEVVPPQKSRRSLFSQRNAASAERIADVFRAHAPAIDEYGNASHLVLPKIAKVTKDQRDRALELWRKYDYVPSPNTQLKHFSCADSIYLGT